MLRLEADKILGSLGYIVGALAEWRVQSQVIQAGYAIPQQISVDARARFLVSLDRIHAAANEMEMVAATAAAERARAVCGDILFNWDRLDAAQLRQLVSSAEQVAHCFNDEMHARLLFTLPSRHAGYYDRLSPFGERVEDAFPSALRDIEEAGKCRALGRWTASVMHLMRALEVGLEAFAQHYGVPANENWNKVLNEIEASLRQVDRRGHGEEAAQWAAEAGTHLRFIKNAWRNHAMHPRATYDEEQAIAIYDNARSFMQHLAKRVAE